MPTIHISDHVKEELDDLKEREEHTSFDSLLRQLLAEYDDGDA